MGCSNKWLRGLVVPRRLLVCIPQPETLTLCRRVGAEKWPDELESRMTHNVSKQVDAFRIE